MEKRKMTEAEAKRIEELAGTGIRLFNKIRLAAVKQDDAFPFLEALHWIERASGKIEDVQAGVLEEDKV